MDLYAAVDLLEGGAVRLVRGDFERRRPYGDPLALARSFAAAGAPWLHVVDLDAARSGVAANRAVVTAIVGAATVPVQVGGGVRAEADVEELVAAGAARVVLGTAALEDPDRARELAAAHPGRVALGLDYRRRPGGRLEVGARGWVDRPGPEVAEVLAALAGAPLGAVVVTAIDRDGTLAGPDLEGLARVLEQADAPVLASGGVGSAGDLRALASLGGVAGVVVGRALVDGRLSVEEAVAACAASG